MPEFVNGLPLHALIVHFVVVLLPLSVLGAAAIAVWPAARARFGWLVVAAAAVATILVPVATSSGTKLAGRLPDNALLSEHERLGERMLYFALPLLVTVTALMILHRVGQRRRINWIKPAIVIIAVLTIGSSVATAIHVFRVGEAGTRTVWDGVQNLPPQ